MAGILRGIFLIASITGLLLVGTLAALRLEPSTAYLPMFQKSNDPTGVQSPESTLNLVTPTGNIYKQMYESDVYIQSVSVSPDGQWLYLFDDQSLLTRLRTDSWEYQHLPYTPGFFGLECFSPDGQWIVYEHRISTYGGLHRMRPDGTDMQKITDPLWSHFCKDWTPDSEWIIFQNFFTEPDRPNTDIYRIRPDGTDMLNITNHPGIDEFGAISGDGQWVIFWSGREGNGDIFRVRIDGTDMENLTNHPAEDKGFLSIHGQWIYFLSERGGNLHLYRMHLDGSGLEQLSQVTANWGFSHSPDGCWIVFLSDDRLYRMRSDGSQLKLIAENMGPLYNPGFSPDSNRYYFWTEFADMGFVRSSVRLKDGRLYYMDDPGRLVGFLNVDGLTWQSTYSLIAWSATLLTACAWLIRRHRNA